MVKFWEYFKGRATVFADLLDVEWERERGGSSMTLRFLTFKNRRKELPLTEVGKAVGGKDGRHIAIALFCSC